MSGEAEFNNVVISVCERCGYSQHRTIVRVTLHWSPSMAALITDITPSILDVVAFKSLFFLTYRIR